MSNKVKITRATAKLKNKRVIVDMFPNGNVSLGFVKLCVNTEEANTAVAEHKAVGKVRTTTIHLSSEAAKALLITLYKQVRKNESNRNNNSPGPGSSGSN